MEERKGRREGPYSNVQELGSRKRRYSEMKHGISAVDLVRWIGRVVNMVPQTDDRKRRMWGSRRLYVDKNDHPSILKQDQRDTQEKKKMTTFRLTRGTVRAPN